MQRTVPFAITDAEQSSERVGTRRSVRTFGSAGADAPWADERIGRYRYEGPHGPLELRYLDSPARTVLEGAGVEAHLELPAPARTDPVLLRRLLDAGVAGQVGDRPFTVVATAAPALAIDLGGVRYELSRAGWFPRVLLSRPDLSVLASYRIVGRRTHRIVEDASPVEVALAVFAARFAPMLAYRR